MDFGIGEIAAALAAASSVATMGTGIAAAAQNSKAASAEAKAINQQTAMDVAAERRQNEELLSKQRALGAAAGVDITSGSPLETALHAAYQGERNAQNIQYQGNLRKYQKRFEASAYKSSIPGLAIGGTLTAGSSLLSAFAKRGKNDPLATIGGTP